MADVFSLAPEGQAWTDDKTTANPARPEDYDPTFFQVYFRTCTRCSGGNNRAGAVCRWFQQATYQRSSIHGRCGADGEHFPRYVP